MISFNKYLLVQALSICFACLCFSDSLIVCALGSHHDFLAITFIVVSQTWRGVPKTFSMCFNSKQPALQSTEWPYINNFYFFAMALNEVPGLLLPVAWHDLVWSWCQVISLQALGSCGPQCQSVAAGPAGSAPGPGANTLASLAECKQDTNNKVKAHLTDVIWIITRSLVLR